MDAPDGDVLQLYWNALKQGPMVLILHGLEGCAYSKYVLALLSALQQQGIRAAVLQHRNCGSAVNRKATSYHAGFTDDLKWVVRRLTERDPQFSLAVVGYSLGGNILLKALGEGWKNEAVKTAVAVSVPFDLTLSSEHMHRGLNRIYEYYLLKLLKKSALKKRYYQPARLDRYLIRRASTLREFDDLLTAPLHGFAGVEDYYQKCGCRPFLKHIEVPTLILHDPHDPLVGPLAVPSEAELSAQVRLELLDGAGHVGFVQGAVPFRTHYWLEERIVRHLRDLGGFVSAFH